MSIKLVHINEDEVRRAYARWAPVYDFTFGKVADWGRMRTVDHINSKQGRVLEVGVGTGISLPHYMRSLKVTAIDLSPQMLKRARQRVRRDRLKHIEAVLEMDAGAMKFPDDSFDVVVAMYVLTVVPDPKKVMEELERVCRPGGEVIVVNHFSQSHGLRGAVEKALAPFATRLGWRPEFPMETLLSRPRLEIVEATNLKPFGLFTMLRFRKTAESESQAMVRERRAARAPAGRGGRRSGAQRFA